ncbi:MAG: hypothetical protein ACW9XH_08045 [Candidatus Nitrosopumilus sp. bin_32a]
MNTIQKVVFWIFTIALGFVNPLISVGLVILYYLPGIIQDMCKPCKENQNNSEMNSFSDDVMEEMK